MKIYVHVEEAVRGSGNVNDTTTTPRVFTTRVTLSSHSLATIDDVLRACCSAHTKRHRSAAALSLANIHVFTEREQDSATRQHLEHDSRAQKQLKRFLQAADEFDNAGDSAFHFELVFVQQQPNALARSVPVAVAAIAACSQSFATVGSTASKYPPQHQSTGSFSRASDTQTRFPQTAHELLDLGANLMQQRKYRMAAQLYTTLVLPSDPHNAQALVAMGDIEAANKRFAVAIDRWYRPCWQHHRYYKSTSASSSSANQQHAALVLECALKIAQCEFERKRFRESLTMNGELQQALRPTNKINDDGAVNLAVLLPAAACTMLETRVALLQAHALYRLHRASSERQDAAIALLTRLLPDLQDPLVNLDALLLYAQIAFERGKRSEALQMLLHVLVSRSDDRVVRRQLAAFVSGSDGMRLLQAAVPPIGPGAAAAYAFIATILKDHGVLDASIACFEQTLVGNDASASYALNHAHALEATHANAAALDVLYAFFRRNPALAVTDDLRAGTFADALDKSTWRDCAVPGVERMDARWRIDWVVTGDDATGHAKVYCNGVQWPPSLSNDAVAATATKTSIVPDRSEELSPDELDLLACFFTAVKILFLTGRLAILPRLVGLLEPIRADRSLHRTSIRNEQAYYVCIAQLLSIPHRFFPTTSDNNSHRESNSNDTNDGTEWFVCGDSHTLATAWREVRVQQTRVVLRPALVTGLKHWHLRRDAVFYPKANFWAVMRALPRNAHVVFVFGEIDCREGILVAVEKGKYETIEQGMEATIAIFLDALRDAVQQFGFQAFVHPVVPVLPETRHLVTAYNRIFERRVRACNAFCTWLNCFDGLLDTPTGKEREEERQLRPAFALDGTHLHPRYIDVLEQAINDVQ